MAIVRTADTDDDGTGTTGTIRNNAWKTAIYAAIDNALHSEQTTTATGTNNDFALTAGITTLRCNNATLLTITGLVAAAGGQRLEIVSVGAGQVDFPNQSASSSAANRIINGVAATISLAPGGSLMMMYDGSTGRWRVVKHNQGTQIAVTFAAGNFTASSGAWTVASGDQITFAYIVDGPQKLATIWVCLELTTVTATPFGLYIAMPGGLSCPTRSEMPFYYAEGAGSTLGGIGLLRVETTTITCFKPSIANWITTTDTTEIRFTTTFGLT